MKKKLGALLIALVIALSAAPSSALAASDVILSAGGFATVLEVIDGQSFKVKPYGTEDTALVRLAGVDAGNSDKAKTYLTEKLMGKLVLLEFDNNVGSLSGRFNVMVVTCDEVVVNREIIENGYASIASGYESAAVMKNLRATSAYLPDDAWRYGDTYYNYNFDYGTDYSGYYGYYDDDYYNDYYHDGKDSETPHYGHKININTATRAQLEDYLKGVDYTLAGKIISYRNENGYFNSAGEFDEVSGVTLTIYKNNVDNIKVCTNINSASRMELMTLSGFTSRIVDDVVSYRNKHKFKDIEELVDEGVISRSVFNRNEDYISVSNVSSLNY